MGHDPVKAAAEDTARRHRIDRLLERAVEFSRRGRVRLARTEIEIATRYARSADDFDAVVSAINDVLRSTDLSSDLPKRAERRHRAERSVIEMLLRQTQIRRDELGPRSARLTGQRVFGDRLVRLLKLLVYSDQAAEMAQIQPLIEVIGLWKLPWPDAVERDVGDATRAWGEQIWIGFARGQEAASTLALAPLADQHPRLVRELRKAAVQLVAIGAEVPGLAEDATPLVAFALLAGVLPAGPRAENEELEDELIGAMLHIADISAKLPSERRLAFLSYYRLAFLLGLAEGYAERLSLSKLSVS